MMWAFKTLIRQCFSNFSHLKEIHKKREENHEKDQNTKKKIYKSGKNALKTAIERIIMAEKE